MFKNRKEKRIPPFFLTLTFAENITDIVYANKEFTKFIQRFNYELFSQKKMKLAYIAVPQFQERGAVHYHCVLFNMPFIKNDVYGTIRKIWRHGRFVNLEKITNSWSIHRYLRRYMKKNFEDGRLKSKRKYFASRSILRPIVLRDDIAIELLTMSLKDKYLFDKRFGIFPTTFIGNVYFQFFTLKFPLSIFDLPLDEYLLRQLNPSNNQ